MLPILNKTLIEHVISYLPSSVEEVFLTAGHGQGFPERFLSEKFPEKEIKVIIEEEPLGTGGAVKALERHINDDFAVLNGDILSSLDIGNLATFHRKKNPMGTISLYRVDDPRPFGVIETAEDGKVLRFEEKPESPFSNLINAGTYVFSPDILDHIPGSGPVSIEKDVFPNIAEKMYGFEFEGYWTDCGTFETFLDANRMLLSEHGPLTNGEFDDVDLVKDVHLDHCTIRGGAIGPNAVVGKGSEIVNAAISNSVIFEHVMVGPDTKIENSIIGEGCRIGKKCYIGGGVLGDGIEIKNGSRIVNQSVPSAD